MKNYLEFEKEIKTLETDLEIKKSIWIRGISEVDTQKIIKQKKKLIKT